jgi:hypothetical protein
MATNDYKEILAKEFAEFGQLILRRQQVEFEIAQKHQFIRAALNMLPDEDRATFEAKLSQLAGESLGLTDAIRKALQSNPKKAHTATDVRNTLKEMKFDFSRYTSNELASIHSVLKRLKPEEVETTDIDGVMAWRWVGPIVRPGMISKAFDDLLQKMWETGIQQGGGAVPTLGSMINPADASNLRPKRGKGPSEK